MANGEWRVDVHHPLLAIHDSLLATLYSLLAIHDSLLAIRYSLFPIRHPPCVISSGMRPDHDQ